MIELINELNESNSSLHKIDVLKKYKDNELAKRILKLAYDRASYTYGVSFNTHWKDEDFSFNGNGSLGDALDFLEQKLATRELTGHAAIEATFDTLNSLSHDDFVIVKGVLNRDLKVNVGRTVINKVMKNLIVKPAYMRCGLFDKKSTKKIEFPAVIQLKADGTYREALVENGKVSFTSRSGITYEYPILESQLSKAPSGYYFGELVVEGTTNRAESNGMINSDTPPHDKIIFHVWDFVEQDEYVAAKSRDKKNVPTTPYSTRFVTLKSIVDVANLSNVKVIESHEVNNPQEAMVWVAEWMNAGLEGGVLKDKRGVFKDGTSPHQLKMKLDIEIEVRVSGFREGTPGTVREKTFGAILFETDDGMIKGSTSGFSDAQLKDFNSRRQEIIGKVMTVRCNDITRGSGSDHYALSHPRFIEFRDDKDETDTIDRAFEAKKMAMELKF